MTVNNKIKITFDLQDFLAISLGVCGQIFLNSFAPGNEILFLCFMTLNFSIFLEKNVQRYLVITCMLLIVITQLLTVKTVSGYFSELLFLNFSRFLHNSLILSFITAVIIVSIVFISVISLKIQIYGVSKKSNKIRHEISNSLDYVSIFIFSLVIAIIMAKDYSSPLIENNNIHFLISIYFIFTSSSNAFLLLYALLFLLFYTPYLILNRVNLNDHSNKRSLKLRSTKLKQKSTNQDQLKTKKNKTKKEGI